MGEGVPGKASLLGYFKTSLVFFALAGVFAVFAAFVPQLRLTLFGEGAEQLALYGFVGLALFGAIHYLAPRLAGVENEKFVCLSGGAVTIGVLVYAAAFIVGGIIQQHPRRSHKRRAILGRQLQHLRHALGHMFGWASLATLDLADCLGSDAHALREILLGQVKLAAVLADALTENHLIVH